MAALIVLLGDNYKEKGDDLMSQQSRNTLISRVPNMPVEENVVAPTPAVIDDPTWVYHRTLAPEGKLVKSSSTKTIYTVSKGWYDTPAMFKETEDEPDQAIVMAEELLSTPGGLTHLRWMKKMGYSRQFRSPTKTIYMKVVEELKEECVQDPEDKSWRWKDGK
jgi:hypothetical protein